MVVSTLPVHTEFGCIEQCKYVVLQLKMLHSGNRITSSRTKLLVLPRKICPFRTCLLRYKVVLLGIKYAACYQSEKGSLHNEELHFLYRSLNIVRTIKSRRLRWAGHLARMKEGRNAFKILTGTPAGKRSLERPRRR